MSASPRTIQAGGASIALTLDSAAFYTALQQVGDRLRNVGKTLTTGGAALTGAGGLLLAPLLDGLRVLQQAGDQAAKFADRYGVAAESVAGLALAAKYGDTDLEQLGKAIGLLNTQAGLVAKGLPEALKKLEVSGLDPTAFANTDAMGRLRMFAEAIANAGTAAERSAIASRLIGVEVGAKLMPILIGGAKAFDQAQARAARFGTVISGPTAQAAAVAGDRLTDLTESIQGLRLALGSPFLDRATDVVRAITQIVVAGKEWATQNADTIRLVAALGLALVTVGGVLLATGATITGVGLAIVSLKIALAGLATVATPLIVVLGVTAALGTTAMLAAKTWGREFAKMAASTDTLRDRVKAAASIIGESLGGALDALVAGEWQLAIQIAMTGMELALRTGIENLSEQWRAFFRQVALYWDALSTTVAEILGNFDDAGQEHLQRQLEPAHEARERAGRQARVDDIVRLAALRERLAALREEARLARTATVAAEPGTVPAIPAPETPDIPAPETPDIPAPETPDIPAMRDQAQQTMTQSISALSGFAAPLLAKQLRADTRFDRIAEATAETAENTRQLLLQSNGLEYGI